MKTVKLIFCVTILQGFCFCQGPRENALAEGDLLFQASEPTAFAEAISAATAEGDGLPSFEHVGIFLVLDGDSVVVEATPRKGVVATPLSEFMAEGRKAAGEHGVMAMRVAAPIDIADVKKRALARLGQEYDWEFEAGNGKAYCSELVQECYVGADGAPIFESEPMNFSASDGSMPQFWIDLYASLDKPIPQGLPGTNPNTLSRSPLLHPLK